MNYTLLAITVVLGTLRVLGVTNEAYQALAHLFVGGLFAGSLVQYSWTWADGGLYGHGGREALFQFNLALALTAVEVACFIYFRFLGA